MTESKLLLLVYFIWKEWYKLALQKHILTIDNVQYVLPVPPSSWEIEGSNNVGSTNVINFGEMNNGSQPNLKTTSISSFFPIKNLGFISECIIFNSSRQACPEAWIFSIDS